MIERYDIKKINGEEVLYVYINHLYEFGLFENKNNISLKDTIKNFIKRHKVAFNGMKVCIIASGILIGTLFLGGVNKNQFMNPTISRDNIYRINSSAQLFKNYKIKEIVAEEETKENIKSEDVVEEVKANDTEESNTSIKPTTTTTSSINKSKSSTNTTTSNVEKKVTDKIETTTSTPITSTMVTVVRSSGIVLQLDLEEYLIGVVGAEMPASFHPEALKAQALAARTYALKKTKNGQALSDTVKDQAYKDNTQLKALWGDDYNYYYAKIKTAVDATRGEYITYNGKYIDAVYFSTSNGMTENSVAVWGNDIPYLKSVSSVWDLNVSSFNATVTKSTNELIKILGLVVDENTEIEVISRTESGRVAKIQIGDSIYGAVELRSLLGLRSTDFDISVSGSAVTIVTKGYGHGVGMSQYGASGMAKAGYNYRQIITHYYTGVTIGTM